MLDSSLLSCPSSPEALLPDPPVHYIGFTPRGQHRILHQSPPFTEAKMDMLRIVRHPQQVNVPLSPTPRYLMWLEISRLPPLLPLHPDKPYNSSVWRQLTTAPQAAFGRGPIPPPSRMEGNTWQKFALCRSAWKQERESPKLRVLTQSRVPPTDVQGNIIPPKGFKRYAERRSIDVSTPKAADLPSNLKPLNETHKITLQENNLHKKLIQQRYKDLQGSARSVVPNNSRIPTPRESP
ncbi:testis-expressed protein 52 [Xenopus laevis]|uniref:Testis-expressed protein 52 n=2 Tax=Xenopus laevis TaxID=8355 RepID=A0A1L8GWD0_XENLA|nr:testis-expressed protein 52 [Xenopus laevis]OCT88130.1 hypothetical protein XELAEV_18016761mg [Xenopus laevis]